MLQEQRDMTKNEELTYECECVYACVGVGVWVCLCAYVFTSTYLSVCVCVCVCVCMHARTSPRVFWFIAFVHEPSKPLA